MVSDAISGGALLRLFRLDELRWMEKLVIAEDVMHLLIPGAIHSIKN